MDVSESDQLTGERMVGGRVLGFAKLVLLILPPLLAFFLARWVGYDIPNLSQPWEFIGQGPLQTPVMGQEGRPFIPFTLNQPPGEVVDYYQGTMSYGIMHEEGPSYYVMLRDGTIWRWSPIGSDVLLFVLHILGVVYGVITLVVVCVLLRLGRLWSGTWFWLAAVQDVWELGGRVILSTAAALILGGVIMGLFSLLFADLTVIVMAILTMLIAVPCCVFIRNQFVAVSLPVIVATGILIWNKFLDIDRAYLDSLLVVGLLTALIVKMLVAYFRSTTMVSPSERPNSIRMLT